MGTTEPIRSIDDIRKLNDFYRTVEPNERNALLITMGLNTALRISDLLSLRWQQVFDFDVGKIKKHIELIERKTGKLQKIAINQNVRKGIMHFKNNLKDSQITFEGMDYLFKGKNNKNLSGVQAYRIIRHAAESLHLGNHISCHLLRKTFGYFAWKNGTQPAVLMEIYNHSSYEITKRYLGIDQDDKDVVFLKNVL